MKAVQITQPAGRRDIELNNVIFYGETVQLQYEDLDDRLTSAATPVFQVYDAQNRLLAKSDVFVQEGETNKWVGNLSLNTRPLFLLFALQSPGWRADLFGELHCQPSPNVIGKGRVTVGNNAKAIQAEMDVSGGDGGGGPPVTDDTLEVTLADEAVPTEPAMPTGVLSLRTALQYLRNGLKWVKANFLKSWETAPNVYLNSYVSQVTFNTESYGCLRMTIGFPNVDPIKIMFTKHLNEMKAGTKRFVHIYNGSGQSMYLGQGWGVISPEPDLNAMRYSYSDKFQPDFVFPANTFALFEFENVGGQTPETGNVTIVKMYTGFEPA